MATKTKGARLNTTRLIRIDGTTDTGIRKAARAKGLTPSAWVRMVIMERIAQDRP